MVYGPKITGNFPKIPKGIGLQRNQGTISSYFANICPRDNISPGIKPRQVSLSPKKAI